MSVSVVYQARARATGGRDGRARTLDGKLELDLSTPKALGGPGGDGANPEQLFALGYAACFLNALKFTALRAKDPFPADAAVTATVGIGNRSEGGFGLTVGLAIELPGLHPDAAQALVEFAHQTCPYSNAIRGNIDVEFSFI